MTALRGGAQQVPAPRMQVNPHTVTIALAAALAVALTALVIVLATSGGGSDPIRIAPTSGPIPPSAAERHQQPGLDGPGMRP